VKHRWQADGVLIVPMFAAHPYERRCVY